MTQERCITRLDEVQIPIITMRRKRNIPKHFTYKKELCSYHLRRLELWLNEETRKTMRNPNQVEKWYYKRTRNLASIAMCEKVTELFLLHFNSPPIENIFTSFPLITSLTRNYLNEKNRIS